MTRLAAHICPPFLATQVLEQPVELTTLSGKYQAFATDFVTEHARADAPFFLYVPFSHVHTTREGSTPGDHYASCAAQNTTKRGPFGHLPQPTPFGQ